jgi:hypothetical protein
MPVNTAALKTFAPAMRRQLLEAVGRKLDLLLNSQTPDTLSTYARQIAELREQEAENREQLLERVAYTWFNRLCALRYLDARGWHPFGCKVLMPAGEGETQPELLKLMRAGSLPAELRVHTNESRLHDLLDGQIPTAIAGANPQAEVYRELVLASCRFYHELLPDLFEDLDHSTELLLPDDILTETSITTGLRNSISDDDCQDVEILGWLYQFYISEKKDEVMARKKAVSNEDIPAVTQLFTPHWIVRYLVENSLGRLWLHSRPKSRLREYMPYYVEDSEGQTQASIITVNSPQEIKLLDPACGSGHMLTYAFDLLTKIYAEEGYSPSEIAEKIVTYNLFGLEICPRAAQLASFAVVCKSREQSRRAFSRPLQPQVMCLRDVALTSNEIKAFIDASGTQFTEQELAQIHQFRQHTGALGTLIRPILDGEKLEALKRKIGRQAPAGDILVVNTYRKLSIVLKQATMLAQKYQAVVANPPYMGTNNQNKVIADFGKINYPDSRHNMFAMSMQASTKLACAGGLVGYVTMESWLFLSSFEALRKQLSIQASFITFSMLESMVMGIAFGTTAFVFSNQQDQRVPAAVFRIGSSDVRAGELLKPLSSHKIVSFGVHRFRDLPGCQFVFSKSERLFEILKKAKRLSGLGVARRGLQTGNSPKFIRVWSECSIGNCEISASSPEEARRSTKKWHRFNNGGSYRKWYGNWHYLVNWEDNGSEIRKERSSIIPNEELYFKPAISWPKATSGMPSFRYHPAGILPGDASPCFYSSAGDLKHVLAVLNSTATAKILELTSPTLNFEVGLLSTLPVTTDSQSEGSLIADQCINLARRDWDNFETSWGFQDLPLLRPGYWQVHYGKSCGHWKGSNLATSWANYTAYCTAAIQSMQELETENNRLWIHAYGLQDEMTPHVPEDEITLASPEQHKDVASFLSYAVGCIMGRYSLDQPGLILADSFTSQAEHLAAYEEKVGKPINAVQFKPDPDAIITVLDGEWFEDDIVARTREFLEVTFPESTVTENLRFIEESLGKDIRKYFCSEFYKDHLQTYKKRPIYWMVQSPKKGFACLVYLHRYTKDTLNQVLNNYFRPYLQKLEARLAQLGLDQLNDSLPTRERTAARKEAEKITKVLKECQAWEQDALLPLAQQRIELDLDDGVKVNYLKLQDVLAPIPGLAAKED